MLIITLACVLGTVATHPAQVGEKRDPAIEQHIRGIIAELPIESALRRELLSGARGNGIRQPWMDEMRRDGVKRAVVQIAIHFDRHGRAKRMVLKSTQFFATYGEGTPISDATTLNNVHVDGLEQALRDLALQRAAHGTWIDVPRPRPVPFDGGARLEFFDDEWLPTPSVPLYCAGKDCLSETETKQ